MQPLLEKAGLTAAVLKDPSARASAIDEYNAKAGGLRALMRGGKLESAQTHEIPSKVSEAEAARYLQFIASGKRIPILFAAGRATRLKLPRRFDRLGIGGLTPKILSRLDSLRQGDEAPESVLEADEQLTRLVDDAAAGVTADASSDQDLSFLQRQLIQLRFQTGLLFEKHPKAGVTLGPWLSHAKFAVVANDENKHSLALQLAAVRFAGLKPQNVYVIVQPEEHGWEVLTDGRTRVYEKETWPEGHGKPFLDMQAEPASTYRLNARGHLVPLKTTFAAELHAQGVERAVFAQVNDLHLLQDMAHLERWVAADRLIAGGAEMVMEVVTNELKQKGGGVFSAADGNAVMRDTIAMKTKDLEPYSIPGTLSRMFYELTVAGIAKLVPQALPAYLTERRTADGRPVLTKEYFSGDASGVLKARAMRQPALALDTFKVQSRIGQALQAMQEQDAQPGFYSVVTHLK